jgi:hypothetical protein
VVETDLLFQSWKSRSIRQRSFAVSTSVLIFALADGEDSRYFAGSFSPSGHSIGSHSCGHGSARQ